MFPETLYIDGFPNWKIKTNETKLMAYNGTPIKCYGSEYQHFMQISKIGVSQQHIPYCRRKSASSVRTGRMRETKTGVTTLCSENNRRRNSAYKTLPRKSVDDLVNLYLGRFDKN